MARARLRWLRANFRKAFGSASAVAVFVLLPGALDCFGVRSQTDELSQTLMLQGLAPFYPGPDQVADVPPDEVPVAVVTLDQDFLRHTGSTWPLGYAEYARLVRRIAELGPRAIFLDLLFTQPRGSSEERAYFGRALKRVRQGETAVLVGAPHPCLASVRDEVHYDGMEPGRGLIQPVVGAATAVVTEWAGYGERYPLVIDVERFEQAVATGHQCAQVEAGTAWRTPALALFEIYCGDHPDLASCQRSGEASAAAPDRRFSAPMVVRWRAEVPANAGRLASIRACGLVRPDWLQRVAWSLSVIGEQAGRGAFRMGDRAFEPCPATLTLSAAALFPKDAEGRFVRDDAIDRGLEELLAGRIVLVGTDMVGTGDSVVSPVHGQLPGVYLHAMALENLLHYGDSYLREPWHPTSRLSWFKGIELTLAFSIALVVGFLGVRVAQWKDASEEARLDRIDLTVRIGIVWLSSLVAVLLLAMGMTWLSRTSPINWLGLFAALGLSVFFGPIRSLWQGADLWKGLGDWLRRPEAAPAGTQTGEEDDGARHRANATPAGAGECPGPPGPPRDGAGGGGSPGGEVSDGGGRTAA